MKTITHHGYQERLKAFIHHKARGITPGLNISSPLRPERAIEHAGFLL